MATDKAFRDWLTNRLDRIEDCQTEMSSHLDRNTASLEIHIAGVKAVNKRVDQVQAQIEPVISVIRFGAVALKLFIAAGAAAGAVAGFLKLFG
jgi:fructose-1,6-bisphosphatase/inositol monophosphatase family enzyme